MTDTRLIERWLPIGALGEESVRERRISLQGNVLPPNNSLHVWWARRPLVACRAAILASLLSENADREKFLYVLGIHGNPLEIKKRLARAKRTGERLGADPYGYPRAYRYVPSNDDKKWIESSLAIHSPLESILVLDPTAGGGAIPFEASRLGFSALSNDLNPVAALIEKATVEYPQTFGVELLREFELLSKQFLKKTEELLANVFPAEDPNIRIVGYLWSRTIHCPYCEGEIPLSPHWRITSNGTGIKLKPGATDPKRCDFELVHDLKEHSPATISKGDATCPYPNCGRVIDGDEVKKHKVDPVVKTIMQ